MHQTKPSAQPLPGAQEQGKDLVANRFNFSAITNDPPYGLQFYTLPPVNDLMVGYTPLPPHVFPQTSSVD